MELTKNKSSLQRSSKNSEKYSRLIENNNGNQMRTNNITSNDDEKIANNLNPNKMEMPTKNTDKIDLAEIGRKLSKKQKKASFIRLMKQAKPEWHLVCFGIVFSAFGSVSYLVLPVLMGAIIDSISISPNNLRGPINIFCNLSPFGCDESKHVLQTAVLCLMIIAVFTSIFSFGKWYALEIAGERVVAKIRKQLFECVLEQEIAMFDITKTGEIVSRLSSDCTVIKYVCTAQIAQTLQSICLVVMSIIYVLYLSWDLTLVMLSVVPIVVIIAKFYGDYYRKQSEINQAVLAEATNVATESISLVRTVKSFSKEDYQCQKYGHAIDLTYKQGVKMAMANGLWMGIFNIIANAGIGCVLWYGSTKVLNGKMNPGELSTYIILTIQIGFSFGSFISLYSTIMKALGASERVFQLIDRKSEIPSGGIISMDNISNKRTLNGHIQLNNVKFSYPSRPNVVVLDGLTLEVNPGKITALVGESGGGKSTVSRLIMRFYDPNSGDIYVDNKPLKDYDLRWLHTQIGYVSQEPVLFGATIRENIVYGLRHHIKESEMIEAAKTANAHDFINSFPDGYDTLVGERGIRLSGGQKQRVCIARAILMNPKILLLDEATSALDAESEYLVQDALEKIMIGRSVLVIAHRLSTVKRANNVIVIEKGKCIESGNHNQLINKNGVYSKLVKRQLFQQ
mmetsp:Transcript_13827/g.17042  ORF Transcript_13827/g.17042 Transcript_13827/m.17042 type:complete len:681 (+) Transcript_13827:70-2112(+)